MFAAQSRWQIPWILGAFRSCTSGREAKSFYWSHPWCSWRIKLCRWKVGKLVCKGHCAAISVVQQLLWCSSSVLTFWNCFPIWHCSQEVLIRGKFSIPLAAVDVDRWCSAWKDKFFNLLCHMKVSLNFAAVRFTSSCCVSRCSKSR